MPRHTRMARGPRPRYTWVPGDDQANATAATSINQSVDLLGNYLNDSGRDTGPGMVIERIMGTLVVEPGAVNTLNPFMCGLLVTTEGGIANASKSKGRNR